MWTCVWLCVNKLLTYESVCYHTQKDLAGKRLITQYTVDCSRHAIQLSHFISQMRSSATQFQKALTYTGSAGCGGTIHFEILHNIGIL
jgi:hypothetical protein